MGGAGSSSSSDIPKGFDVCCSDDPKDKEPVLVLVVAMEITDRALSAVMAVGEVGYSTLSLTRIIAGELVREVLADGPSVLEL